MGGLQTNFRGLGEIGAITLICAYPDGVVQSAGVRLLPPGQ